MRMNLGVHLPHAGKPAHRQSRQAEDNSARSHIQKQNFSNNEATGNANLLYYSESDIVEIMDSSTNQQNHQEENPFGNLNAASMRPENAEQQSAPLQDNSPELTRRLRSATHMLPIQSVIKDAFKDMAELRLVVATGSDDDADRARAIIRRLERVVSRSSRKIRDLESEARMTRDKERALADEKVQRAREIERELTQRIRRRQQREREWVRSAERDAANCTAGQDDPIMISGSLSAAQKAQIAAQAAAMAAAEAAFDNMMSGSGFSGGGMSGYGQLSAGSGGAVDGASGGEAVSVDAVV